MVRQQLPFLLPRTMRSTTRGENPMKRTIATCLLAAMATLLGCPPSDPTSAPQPDPEPAQEPHTPADYGDVEMANPSVCEWAVSNDALILGTVTDVRFASSPLATTPPLDPSQPYRSWMFISSCEEPAILKHALDLTVQVSESIRGDLSEDSVTVRLGMLHAADLDPPPQLATNDASVVEWDAPAAEGNQPLVPGLRVLLPLHSLPGGSLSLMGDSIIVEDAEGIARFQQPRERFEYPPDFFADGATIESALALLRGCSDESFGSNRKTFLREARGPDGDPAANPAYYSAAWCTFPASSPDLPEGTCLSVGDCSEGEICNTCSGLCQPRSDGPQCHYDGDCVDGQVCDTCNEVCFTPALVE